jgi:molecular chaperone GrpE
MVLREPFKSQRIAGPFYEGHLIRRLFSEVSLTEGPDKIVQFPKSSDSQSSERDKNKAVQRHSPSEPVALSGEQGDTEVKGEEIAEKDPLEAAKKEAAENRDRWMRAVADLENYKKRTIQERSALLKYKNDDLLRDLLPVTDNIRRAVDFCNKEGRADPVVEGICMISEMLQDLLKKYGVTEIEALGQPFDPNFHEAIAKVASKDGQPNTVIEVMEKGYKYQDRLLRAAKVVIAAAKEP